MTPQSDPSSGANAAPSTDGYYISIQGGEPQGPHNAETVRGWIRDKRIVPNEVHAWKEGWPAWKPISDVGDLLGSAPPRTSIVKTSEPATGSDIYTEIPPWPLPGKSSRRNILKANIEQASDVKGAVVTGIYTIVGGVASFCIAIFLFYIFDPKPQSPGALVASGLMLAALITIVRGMYDLYRKVPVWASLKSMPTAEEVERTRLAAWRTVKTTKPDHDGVRSLTFVRLGSPTHPFGLSDAFDENGKPVLKYTEVSVTGDTFGIGKAASGTSRPIHHEFLPEQSWPRLRIDFKPVRWLRVQVSKKDIFLGAGGFRQFTTKLPSVRLACKGGYKGRCTHWMRSRGTVEIGPVFSFALFRLKSGEPIAVAIRTNEGIVVKIARAPDPPLSVYSVWGVVVGSIAWGEFVLS